MSLEDDLKDMGYKKCTRCNTMSFLKDICIHCGYGSSIESSDLTGRYIKIKYGDNLFRIIECKDIANVPYGSGVNCNEIHISWYRGQSLSYSENIILYVRDLHQIYHSKGCTVKYTTKEEFESYKEILNETMSKVKARIGV